MEGRHMSKGYKPKKITTEYYDYERNGTEISVANRLKDHADYWRQIGCNEYILSVIENGYVIPLTGEIEKAQYRNNLSSRERPEFVREAIDDLIQGGAVMESKEPPWVVNPLTVATKGDKLRLVIDLRHLNPLLVKTKCKFEGLETAAQYLKIGNYMINFDLKAGYHHVGIAREQQTLLGFAYKDHTGKLRYFYFTVLPFGLATAGQIFTKIMRELVKFWRSQTIQAIVFLDDGFQTNTDKKLTKQHALIMKGSLLAAGWVPNRKKSIWEPTRVLTWLGFEIDLVDGIIRCTEKRLRKTKKLIEKILSKDQVPVKWLSKINGVIVSLERSHGDVVFLRTRFLSLAVAEAFSWAELVEILPPLVRELKFWGNNVRHLNGRTIITDSIVNQIIYSDASGTGCASVMVDFPTTDKLIVNKTFSAEEAATSSTERELIAVLHGLIELKEVLDGQAVVWFTDSKNVARIVRRGSMKVYLLNLDLGVYEVTKKHGINLQVQWIPRSENEEADLWSRVTDFNNWGVRAEWFVKICSTFNLNPTVDRFADFRNKKVKRYNSRFYHSGAEATDAFSQDWGEDVNWVVPPLYLVNRALEHARFCKAIIILVTPLWKSTVFWPQVQRIMQSQSNIVRGKIVMGDIFEGGTTPSSIFGSPTWKGESLALYLDFRTES